MTSQTDPLYEPPSLPAAAEAWWAGNLAVIVLATVCSLAVAAVTFLGDGRYGFTLFLVSPLVTGFATGFARAWSRRDGVLGASFLTTAGLLLPAAFLLLFRWEGLICLAMAAPLVWLEALAACLIGYGVASIFRPRSHTNSILGCVFLLFPALPLAGWVEAQLPATPPTHIVRSTLDVNASPENVWPFVVDLPDMPPPREWYFHAGVGYPLRARTVGRGPGAMRYCDFSTGSFPEIVEVWEQPRLFRFRITAQAPPMTELNPFGHTHPPHLDGHFVSERGEFRLEPLPGGSTRIHATSWYHHHIAPVGYWRVWSDFLVGRIHHRVLNHIRTLAELSARETPAARASSASHQVR
jgi:hypothetical protein